MNIQKINVEDEIYPQRLLKTKNFPTEIYAIGNIELLNAKSTLGIVGSRNCTDYGRKVANEFAKELSKRGRCIISGMAIGIDGAAHNAAIVEQGKTIAVLGGGLNYIYPQENAWLFHKILDNGGCVISEYPPEEEPDKIKFPIRNRIISGLSDAVLVIEAEHRSGSTITARYAKNEGKLVYAIPSNIYSSTGIGTNRLIQEGATLVTNPKQIISELKNNEYEHVENKVCNIKNTDTNSILSKEYLEVYKILSDEPIHINKIARKLNKEIYEISPIITMMEIEGYAIQPQINYFTRNK